MREIDFGVIRTIIGHDLDDPAVITVSIANEDNLPSREFAERVARHAAAEAEIAGIGGVIDWTFRNRRIVRAEIIFAELPGNVSVTETAS